MRECVIDWAQLAKEQAQRKYGEPCPPYLPKSQNSALLPIAVI